VGTFYRSPSPAADPFVKIGSNVEPESVVCIIEAMKLMNEIQAEATGEVVRFTLRTGSPSNTASPCLASVVSHNTAQNAQAESLCILCFFVASLYGF